MKPTYTLAAIALATVSATATAQSGVQIYGVLDASFGRFQNAGTAAITRQESGKLFTSFIGFSGVEDLGGGLKASFALEAFLLNDTGNFGRFPNDVFFSRTAAVGLGSNDWGTFRAGRQTTPTRVPTGRLEPLGGSTGFSPAIRQVFSPSSFALPYYGDTAWNNTLSYSTPNYDGLSGTAMMNIGEHAAGSFGNNVGGNVTYYGKEFQAALAYQSVKNGLTTAPTGFKSQDSWLAIATYDFKVVKLYGQVANVKTRAAVGTKTASWSAGATVPVGSGRVLVQYGDATSHFAATNGTNRTLTVGYDYFFSKRTDVYAIAMKDRFTGKTSGNTLAVGLRHAF